jgi:hypothetical protein
MNIKELTDKIITDIDTNKSISIFEIYKSKFQSKDFYLVEIKKISDNKYQKIQISNSYDKLILPDNLKFFDTCKLRNYIKTCLIDYKEIRKDLFYYENNLYSYTE